MAIEIERKFLVRHEALPPLDNGIRIVQGYLCFEPQVRFRIYEEKIVITIKKPQPDGSRFELETEKIGINPDENDALIKMALIPPIEKVRYRISKEGLVWEIDVYQGENKGLITVDVELPSLDFPLVFPEWVANEFEITDNPRYFNTNLGKNPYCKWEQR